jgi:hypothetical protein
VVRRDRQGRVLDEEATRCGRAARPGNTAGVRVPDEADIDSDAFANIEFICFLSSGKFRMIRNERINGANE